ncbi:MAG: hypothetical protein M0010_13335 [Actinomycetota bacterium]|jgi:outer membrane protein assembly factor BamB|nr:hypothetical protein [Actinomycetota bacterium]
MSDPDIRFAGDSLIVGDSTYTMQHPIDAAFPLGTLVILLFAPDSLRDHFGQFPNLIAIDASSGEKVWEAELPSTTTGDRYYKIASREPLVAYSVKSFVCTIDPSTGRITEKEFVK